ncbi:His-Xaa-Ser system protein HxsD [Candidatus Gracilibacteria bacterium 28_42_T64]|nr:His-Xaa-Ser system protein HxsD [Candidatus Gracilibacteria bacterium 28_42_T64]
MEQFLKKEIKNDQLELLIDTKIYSKDIILKAAYMFLDKGYFFFKHDRENNIILQFTAKDSTKINSETLVGSFSDELLSVYLRDKLEKDNKEIRETIVKKAINGPLDTLNFVSFNTDEAEKNLEQNQIGFDKDIDEILKEIENDPDLKIDDAEIEKILKEIEEETGSEKTKPMITINPDAIKKAKDNFKK